MPIARPLSALALSLLVTLPLAASAADAPAPESARVEIRLSDAEGNTIEMIGEHLAYGDTHRLLETIDDHRHDVAIAMKRSDDGKLTVAFTYALDGAKVVERHDVPAKLAEPVKIATKGGQVVFVVKAEAPREKLEVDGSDDPLGGL